MPDPEVPPCGCETCLVTRTVDERLRSKYIEGALAACQCFANGSTATEVMQSLKISADELQSWAKSRA